MLQKHHLIFHLRSLFLTFGTYSSARSVMRLPKVMRLVLNLSLSPSSSALYVSASRYRSSLIITGTA